MALFDFPNNDRAFGYFHVLSLYCACMLILYFNIPSLMLMCYVCELKLLSVFLSSEFWLFFFKSLLIGLHVYSVHLMLFPLCAYKWQHLETRLCRMFNFSSYLYCSFYYSVKMFKNSISLMLIINFLHFVIL